MPTPYHRPSLFNLFDLKEEIPRSYHQFRRAVFSNVPMYSLADLDSIRKGALSKLIAGYFESSQTILFVHLYKVWPSGEIPELFRRIRQSQGLMQSLYECPGELIGPEETDYLLCQTACCLYNCWDFSLCSTDRRLRLYATHDDELLWCSDDSDEHAMIEQNLRDFGLLRVNMP